MKYKYYLSFWWKAAYEDMLLDRKEYHDIIPKSALEITKDQFEYLFKNRKTPKNTDRRDGWTVIDGNYCDAGDLFITRVKQ